MSILKFISGNGHVGLVNSSLGIHCYRTVFRTGVSWDPC